MKLQRFAILLMSGLAFTTLSSHASLVLGTGTGALIGGDLTDPENDGAADANVNYNASFNSSHEPFFGGGEGAFNVFDNILSPRNGKWCCNGPGTAAQDLSGGNLRSVWVEANFDDKRYVLNTFTLASANDVPGRDADQWRILGSNDGINYNTIFEYDNNGTAIWNARYQVVAFSSDMGDFAEQNMAYSIFRYEAYSVVNNSMHQLGEFEIFGQIPEPTSIALLGLGLLGLRARRKA
ncbi:PEP-CTERM sorting domain-containing protein [Aliiglaciecola litoralis]|uniref:Ice-binding protein C-terminal domain-containing protein n=1 Tax=Aliiglaciecola litoralis TaxID=582857 RepID=A0ABN1LEN4_9ALTE